MTKKPSDDDQWPTTGHDWDGIREYDRPMPRWWVITFILCVIFGLGYTIFYPAWPLIKGATPGLLGYSSRGAVAKHIADVNQQNAAIDARLLSTDLTAVKDDADLNRYAVAGGAAVFRTNCAQCHGAGAAGAKGYPNLLDDDWLWGGALETIHTTIAHGIRSELDDNTRFSQMPVFGDILKPDQIAAAAQYVLSVSGQEFQASKAKQGAAIFSDNCAVCHGKDATGGRDLGAPNLTDAIWLYGGDLKTITQTITNARYGVMPAWAGRLSKAQIRQVAIYVHQLGGGE